MVSGNSSPNPNSSPSYLTHGIHDGLIAWVKHSTITRTSQDKEVLSVDVSIVHFQNGSTLMIDGDYDFRIGARYQFQLVNGLMARGMLIESSKSQTQPNKK